MIDPALSAAISLAWSAETAADDNLWVAERTPPQDTATSRPFC